MKCKIVESEMNDGSFDAVLKGCVPWDESILTYTHFDLPKDQFEFIVNNNLIDKEVDCEKISDEGRGMFRIL